MVIPRDERSGSATDAQVPEFMDFVIDDPLAEPSQRERRIPPRRADPRSFLELRFREGIVQLRGGEYFFAPSLSFLRNL